MKVPVVAFALFVSGGCRTLVNAPTHSFRQAGVAVVRVENRGPTDLQIYAVHTFVGSHVYEASEFVPQQVHLGKAIAGTKTEFSIPGEFVWGVSPIRFVGYELNGRSAALDEEVMVATGDKVELSFPVVPNAH